MIVFLYNYERGVYKMAKSYKKKHEEEIIVNEDTISKKEQYDLEKKKRIDLKKKEQKKKNKSSKGKSGLKTKKTNLVGKIFAIFMLLLMVGSVVVSILAPVFG